GNSEYRQSYFHIVRNATLQPVRYFAGSTSREWEWDHLLENPRLEASIFVTEELVQLLEDIKAAFVKNWLVLDARSGEYRLNDDRLREMQLEEDDSYSRAVNVDWNLLALIASRWNLLTTPPGDLQV
ncbi:MAG: hypothetical protein R3310_16185, partial [Candidatus Competibacteraceae bacterium]|nr:hypothetical protein [Candidatus Competibacteraceae bacterium]